MDYAHKAKAAFFLTSQRTRMSHTCNIFISLLNILSGDIQYNPGPFSSTNPRQLWKNINILLHRSSLPDAQPYYDSLSLLCQTFVNFFSDKIHKLITSLLINRISTPPHFPPPFTPPNFSSFTCVTPNEVFKLLSQSPDTNCDLDLIPTSLLKQCSHILLPKITNIINLSLLNLIEFICSQKNAIIQLKSANVRKSWTTRYN